MTHPYRDPSPIVDYGLLPLRKARITFPDYRPYAHGWGERVTLLRKSRRFVGSWLCLGEDDQLFVILAEHLVPA